MGVPKRRTCLNWSTTRATRLRSRLPSQRRPMHRPVKEGAVLVIGDVAADVVATFPDHSLKWASMPPQTVSRGLWGQQLVCSHPSALLPGWALSACSSRCSANAKQGRKARKPEHPGVCRRPTLCVGVFGIGLIAHDCFGAGSLLAVLHWVLLLVRFLGVSESACVSLVLLCDQWFRLRD